MGGWGETLEVEERKEALLQCVRSGETGGGGSLPLVLAAGIDNQGFPAAA